MPADTQQLPLRDIHLPDAISWWPPAIGWWLVLLLLLLAIAIVMLIKRQRAKGRIKRAALKELDILKTTYDQHYDAKQFVADLSVLLRRICITVFPKKEVAGLVGNEWLAYLDQCIISEGKSDSPSFSQAFSEETGLTLLNVPYRREIAQGDIDVDSLYQLSKSWINKLPVVYS